MNKNNQPKKQDELDLMRKLFARIDDLDVKVDKQTKKIDEQAKRIDSLEVRVTKLEIMNGVTKDMAEVNNTPSPSDYIESFEVQTTKERCEILGFEKPNYHKIVQTMNRAGLIVKIEGKLYWKKRLSKRTSQWEPFANTLINILMRGE